MQNPTDPHQTARKIYANQGRVVQYALAAGLQDVRFRSLLKHEAMEMRDGDTEILLKDFWEKALSPELEVGDFLRDAYNAAHPEEPVELEMLTALSRNFPSIIIGVRGPAHAWEVESHLPVITLLPLDFKETQVILPAVQADGQLVDLDCSGEASEVFLTVAPSERHDRYGNLKYTSHLARLSQPDPAVSIDEVAKKDEGGGGWTSGAPEPTSCPITTLPTPIGFTAVSSANGITLTWDAGIYPQYANLDSWARWVIYRNGTPIATIFASDPPTFTDRSLNPYDTYTYTIRFSFITTSGICSSPWAVATATAVGLPDAPQNFDGNVFTAGNINLTWANPQQYIEYIRIELYRFSTNSWVNASGNLLPGTTSMTYPSTDYGARHLFRIRVKGATGWSNPDYALVINPYRNTDQPLLIHAFTIPNLPAIESSALGNPEIHLSATNGSLDGNNNPAGNLISENTFIPLTRCQNGSTSYVLAGGLPMTLISQWSNALYGQIVRVALVETDQTDPFTDDLTESSGQTRTFSVNATIPVQILGVPVNFTSNVNYQTTSGETFSINTVDGDLILGSFDIHYWDPVFTLYTLPTIITRVSDDQTLAAYNSVCN